MSAPAPRLSRATLASLAGKVRRPAYDIERVNPGIVHLGVGNFHRAHQAVFADDALAAGELDWGVTGVSLRSPAVHEALAPQDGLYTVIERDARAPAGRARVIGALRETMVAPRDPAAVVGRIADPATRIVTLTITEKGYCRGADGASLDTAEPSLLATRRRDVALPAWSKCAWRCCKASSSPKSCGKSSTWIAWSPYST